MGFHEIQFPTDVSYGTKFGPGWSTAFIEVDSGSEERPSRWNGPRHRGDLGYGIRTPAALYAVRTFFWGRIGGAYGFRVKDWDDFSSNPNNYRNSLVAPTNVDVVLGAGDGVITQFQLVKKYTSGPVTRTRNIEKPVAGTTVVALNAVNQTSGWSVDTTTGIVTFSSAPGVGVSVSAGFEFDVPMRADRSVDDWLAVSVDDFSNGTASVQVVEIRSELMVADELFPGGATQFVNVTANMTLSQGNGLMQDIQCNSAGVKAILPDATNIDPGGPWMAVNNSGSQTLLVVNSALTTIISLPAGTMCDLWLSVSSGGAKTWFAK